jgi:transcriptional regulator with XRE-family HTH domain
MKIHEKIRELRKEKNWTQEDMAQKLGMSILGYAKVERGETDYQFGLENYLAKIMKIATVLNVDLEKLLEEIEKPIYLVGLITGDNNCFNSPIVGSSSELGFEIQKLQLQLELKDKELALQQREIAYLKELLEMSKKLSGETL